MKRIKLSTRIIIAIVILVVFTVVLDYCNIPTLLGLQMSNFNFDVLHILASVITTVGIFICTYFLIERKRLDRQNNQLQIAEDLLNRVYEECERNVRKLDESGLREYYFLEMPEERRKSIIRDLAATPFIYDSFLMKFGEDGVLPYFITQRYIRVKHSYTMFMNYCIDTNQSETIYIKMRDNLFVQFKKARDELLFNKQEYYTDEEILDMFVDENEDRVDEKE